MLTSSIFVQQHLKKQQHLAPQKKKKERMGYVNFNMNVKRSQMQSLQIMSFKPHIL